MYTFNDCEGHEIQAQQLSRGASNHIIWLHCLLRQQGSALARPPSQSESLPNGINCSVFWDITRVVRWKYADVSEEHVTSMFGAEEGKKAAWKQVATRAIGLPKFRIT
jgi:hypothetical protein